MYVIAVVRHNTMITTDCLFVLTVVVQAISAQGPPPGPPPGFDGLPDKCRGPPPDIENPHECCQVAPMYSQDELSSCGFEQSNLDGKPDQNSGQPDCSKQVCLLNKKGFLDGDGTTIKYDAIAVFLDQWTQENQGFKQAVDIAKGMCMGQGGPPGPPQICEANRLMFCMGATMFGNCPAENWQQTDNCSKLKEHMTECRPPLPQ